MPPQTYSYVKKDGNLGYTTDQANAPDIAPTSGFAREMSAPATPTPTPQPTMSEFQNVYTPQQTEADRFQQQLYKSVNEPIDQNQIRQNYINQFQDQINALNQVYDNQLAQARQEGVGRVGSGTAILARRGLTGSPRGESIKEGVLTQNRSIEGAIQNERNIAVQAIYGEATKLAAQEAADKRAAKERGASAYLDYLKGQDTRRESNLTSTIGALISQGVDPSTMDASEISNLAKTLGVDTQSILGSYKVAKARADAQAAAAEAKAMQDGQFNLSEGQSRYDAQGNIIASKGKTYAPGTGGGGSGNPAVDSWVSLISSKQATIANVPAALKNAVAVALGNAPASSVGQSDTTKSVLSLITQLEGRNTNDITGIPGIGAVIPGSDYQRTKNIYDQLKGLLSLENRSMLKGSGAISDYEAKTLERAASSLGTNLGNKDFKSELAKLKAELMAQPAPQGVLTTAPDGQQVEIID
jgi:hypothetical protein